MSALLEVSDLHVHASGTQIVDGVDLAVEHGEALGLAGESGCGKTTTALAMMKLLPGGLEQSGKVTLSPKGVDEPIHIDRRTETGMRYVRWRHISLVFQGALNSLDPVQRIDDQFVEAIRVHSPKAKSSEVRERTAELPRKRGEQRLTLLVRCLRIDEDHDFPVAGEDVPRNVGDADKAQARHVEALDLAGVEVVSDDGVALSVIRVLADPAGAEHAARAGLDQRALERIERPGAFRHLLSGCHRHLLSVVASSDLRDSARHDCSTRQFGGASYGP